MALPEINWKELTQEELGILSQNLTEETNRREQVATLPNTIDNMLGNLKRYQGNREGSSWVKPTDATKAYPRGWRTQHNGKTWQSTVSGNINEPGVSDWMEVPTPSADTNQLPQWVKPVSPEQAYPEGAEVSHRKREWVNLRDANMEEPGKLTTPESGWEEKPPVPMTLGE